MATMDKADVDTSRFTAEVRRAVAGRCAFLQQTFTADALTRRVRRVVDR